MYSIESVVNALYIEIKNFFKMLKKFSSDKINDTKIALFFLSQVPTYLSFIFNLRFLYELKIRLSETVSGICHFRFRFAFIKVYIFVIFYKFIFDSLTLKIITPFKIKIEKPHTVLLPDL